VNIPSLNITFWNVCIVVSALLLASLDGDIFLLLVTFLAFVLRIARVRDYQGTYLFDCLILGTAS
jgi:hypothetical protein